MTDEKIKSTHKHTINFWRVISETPKGYLVVLNCRNVKRWFPKSHSVVDEKEKVVRVTDWLWDQIKNNTGQVGLI